MIIDTRIDYERIGDIITPSVSSVLFEAFGSEFCEASLDQRLMLLEAVAYTLREGGEFGNNLRELGYSSEMPCGIFTSAGLSTNEGLKLIAILQVAIVESYSVVAATSKK